MPTPATDDSATPTPGQNDQLLSDTRIVKCQHYRGTKLYWVKLSNNKTHWVNESDVAQQMRNEFHSHYTLAGKRTKIKYTNTAGK